MQALETKLQRQGQTITSLTSFKFNTANYGSQPSIKLTSPKTDKIVLEPAIGEVNSIIFIYEVVFIYGCCLIHYFY